MKGKLRVQMMLLLMIAIAAGCSSQPKFRAVSPERQNLGHARVSEDLTSLLQAAGRDPVGCSLYFVESKNLGIAPAGHCMFGVTTGLANSRDERLLGGVLAQSVALEVLGHAEKRRATSEAIAGVSQLGLPGAITAMTASLLVSQNYSSSQLEDATKRATEILTNVGDPDPAGTLQYALAQLQAVGVVEPWPAGERPDFLQEKVNKAVVPLVTGAERPTYTLGQKWIRNDGEYTLTKIGPDAYVFSVGPDQEIHLTKDLMVGRAQQGGWVTEFESLPQVWPPVVGKWGSGYGRCKIPSEPTMASVRYEWSIDAYEEIQVPAGSFKAFRIVMAWEPTETRAGFGRKRLVSWYAPGVRQLLKAEFTDAGPLNFQVVSVDQQATVAPR